MEPVGPSFPVPFVGLFVVVLLVVALGGWWAYEQEKRRADAKAAYARLHGWTYRGDDDRWAHVWDCGPFGVGRGRQVRHCVEGTYEGTPFVAFEYEYHVERQVPQAGGGTRTGRDRYRFDVAVLRVGARVPDLDLAPENAFARLVDAVTGRDIDLENDAFNRAYRLHCTDRKFAFDVFHARTMEHLVARPGSMFRLVGGDMMTVRRSAGRTAEVWGPGPTFGSMLTVLRGIPDFVWEDRGGRPATLPRVSG